MNYEVIAEYILNNCEKDYKVFEVGVGFNYNVALILNKYLDVVVVDINKKAIDRAKALGLRGYVDDIFNPKLDYYSEANLIYSIRPPLEMYSSLYKLAKIVNAKLIIRPLTTEFTKKLKLKNYKGEIFYIMP
ncbi:UPF0146 family protein [Methanocaldococcus sp.]